MGKHSTKITTRLTKEELYLFKVIKKHVVKFCGKVSDAEVLRYLVRNWNEEDQRI